MSRFGRSLGLGIVLALLSYDASGEIISGTVHDPSGAPIKGAFVRARSETKRNITISVLSDRQGSFRFDSLRPGEYEISVRATGYESKVLARVNLARGKEESVDGALQKGAVRWSDLSNDQGRRLLPEGTGKDKWFGECFICHGFQSRIAGTQWDDKRWLAAMNFMRTAMRFNLGDQVTDQDGSEITEYLTATFGMSSKLPQSVAELPGYADTVRQFTDEAMNIVYVDYELPKPNSFPFSAAPDMNGKVWIPEFGLANRIARLDPDTGEMQEFPVPHKGVAAIHSAVAAPDGTVWIAEQGPNKLAKWDPRTQKVTEYQSPYQPGREGLLRGGSKHTVRIDPKGYVWSSGYPLSRFDPKTEKFTYYPAVPGPYSIAVDRQGNIWFCEINESRIGKIDAITEKVSKWDLPTPRSRPRRLEVDSEGVVWVGEFGAGKIARFDPKTETFREYQLPGPDPSPYAIGIDRNDHVWYSSHNMDLIGRLDPKTGQITEYPFPYSENTLKEFFLDSQGRMWFGSLTNNRVGYFTVATGSGHQ